MRPGTIREAARIDSRFMVWCSGLLLAACIVVLAVHGRYLYNWVAGPFEADAALFTDPGLHRFARITGKLEHSGVVEETSKRLGHVIETSREETAEFFTADVGGRKVIVKVPRDFVGDTVEGRVVEVPERVRSLIERTPIYPWMLDAEHSYRTDWNLPLELAVLLVLPCAWWLRRALYRSKSLVRHPELAKLSKHGDPVATADQIEREMRELGEAAQAGPYWISSAWLVRPKPLLAIHHVDEIAAIATRTRTVKNTTKHEVVIWQFGSATPDTDAMSRSEARVVASRVPAMMPWAVVGDPASFERRWRQDRASEEAAARKRAGR